MILLCLFTLDQTYVFVLSCARTALVRIRGSNGLSVFLFEVVFPKLLRYIDLMRRYYAFILTILPLFVVLGKVSACEDTQVLIVKLTLQPRQWKVRLTPWSLAVNVVAVIVVLEHQHRAIRYSAEVRKQLYC